MNILKCQRKRRAHRLPWCRTSKASLRPVRSSRMLSLPCGNRSTNDLALPTTSRTGLLIKDVRIHRYLLPTSSPRRC